MSGSPEDGVRETPEDERALRAAEYALGVLDTEAHAAAAAEFAADPAFAALVWSWEQQLAPLAATVAPVAPPAGLFERIAGELPAAPPGLLRRLWRSVPFWRGATLAAAAAAAAFAGLAYLRPAPPSLTAVLTASGSDAAVFLAQVQPDGAILIRPTGGQVAVAPAHDLELWALAKGMTVPVSLGVLPADGAAINARSHDGPATTLMVSLEPKGGSPSGKPTGPVVYAGRLDPLR